MDILQPTHILLILVVALLVLGPKRLPEVGRSLGRGLRDFRQGIQGVQDDARGMFHEALDEPSSPPSDSAVSTVPEPLNPATAEPLIAKAPVAAAAFAPLPEPTSTITKVAPVESDPDEYAD